MRVLRFTYSEMTTHKMLILIIYSTITNNNHTYIIFTYTAKHTNKKWFEKITTFECGINLDPPKFF